MAKPNAYITRKRKDPQPWAVIFGCKSPRQAAKEVLRVEDLEQAMSLGGVSNNAWAQNGGNPDNEYWVEYRPRSR